MKGLIEEGSEKIEELEKGSTLDAALIASAQKVEHYEIASYGTLATFAEVLNLQDAKDLLGQTLEEEKEADEKLTRYRRADQSGSGDRRRRGARKSQAWPSPGRARARLEQRQSRVARTRARKSGNSATEVAP